MGRTFQKDEAACEKILGQERMWQVLGGRRGLGHCPWGVSGLRHASRSSVPVNFGTLQTLVLGSREEMQGDRIDAAEAAVLTFVEESLTSVAPGLTVPIRGTVT